MSGSVEEIWREIFPSHFKVKWVHGPCPICHEHDYLCHGCGNCPFCCQCVEVKRLRAAALARVTRGAGAGGACAEVINKDNVPTSSG